MHGMCQGTWHSNNMSHIRHTHSAHAPNMPLSEEKPGRAGSPTWRSLCSPHTSWRWSGSRWPCRRTRRRSAGHCGRTPPVRPLTSSPSWAPSLHGARKQEKKKDVKAWFWRRQGSATHLWTLKSKLRAAWALCLCFVAKGRFLSSLNKRVSGY